MPESAAELARRVAEIYARFEAIALKLETAYVTKEVHDLTLLVLKNQIKELDKKVAELEDDKTWLVRLVLGAIILAFLGAGFAASKAVH